MHLARTLGLSSLCLSLAAVATPAPPAVQAGTAGAMGTARNMHTLTLLPGGKVLAAGGHPRNAGAELFDPVANTWSPTGGLALGGRGWHRATLLKTGKVLLAGGVSADGNPSKTAELYDPALGTFAATAGQLAAARGLHTQTLLPDGRVVIAGGGAISTGAPGTASIEIYDPATDQFSDGGAMLGPRIAHSALLLPSGKILFAGGQTVHTLLTTSELYDPATKTSADAGALGGAHTGGLMLALPDGRVLLSSGWAQVVAGQCVPGIAETWSGSSWTATNAMLGAHVLAAGGLLPSGRALVAADFCGNLEAELFDPVGNGWSAGPSLSASRGWVPGVTLRNGLILVNGGAAAVGVPGSDGGVRAQLPAVASGDLLGEKPPPPVPSPQNVLVTRLPIALAGTALPDTTVSLTLASGGATLATAASDGTFTLHWTPTLDGVYSVSLTQTAIFLTSDAAALQLVYDRTPPVVNITSPVENTLFDVDASITLSATATDALSGVAGETAAIDGHAVTLGAPAPVWRYPLGANTGSVTATDLAGNQATTSVDFRVWPTARGTCSLLGQLAAQGLVPRDSALRNCPQLLAADALLARGLSGPAAQLDWNFLVWARCLRRATPAAQAALIAIGTTLLAATGAGPAKIGICPQ